MAVATAAIATQTRTDGKTCFKSVARILGRRVSPAAGVPAARLVRGGVEGRLARLGATPDFRHGLLVSWNSESLHKFRSAAPGWQGATTENIGHI
jgi:hypothetical protein